MSPEQLVPEPCSGARSHPSRSARHVKFCAVRRDLREILLLVSVVLIGYAANSRWSTHVGGWREWVSNIGGVLFLSGLVILPVALVAAFVGLLRRQFTNHF